MAIDHRILQGIGQKSNQSILDIFNTALDFQRDKPFREQRLSKAQQDNALLGVSIEQAQHNLDEDKKEGGQRETERGRKNTAAERKEYASSIAAHIENGNIPGLEAQLRRNKAVLEARGVDTTGVDEDIIQAQTPEGRKQLSGEVGLVLNPQGQRQNKSVSQIEFDANVKAVEADPELKTTKGRAAAIALGLEAKESLTAAERIANDKKLAERVAEAERLKAEGKETGKSTAQLKFKPQINRAVKLAEREASERGEVLTDLSRMKASMPGLIVATNQLKDLAQIATSTIGGKVFDFAVKETGFGSTKGANARAKFIAIISNQVLPLLKPTFGGAMTEGEGDKLAATLGDADASPTQKVEQIIAFMENKEREVIRLSTQLKDTDDVDLSDPNITIEQLMAERKRLGG